MKAPRFVVVVGSGRLGAHLADRLSQEGHSVVVVDAQKQAFAALSPEYGGFCVEGDATELAVLERAKVARADLLFAVTSDDNVNLMVAQVATRHFAVPRAVARVLDPRRERAFRSLGIHAVPTVCPVAATAEVFMEVAESPATGEGRP